MKGIYRDRRGRLRASTRMFPPVLVDFLQTDVRENWMWCMHLIDGLGRARDGEPFRSDGNLYALDADRSDVEIRNVEDETATPLRLHLDELAPVLVAWSKAIRTPPT